jgi:hypothetical protein
MIKRLSDRSVIAHTLARAINPRMRHSDVFHVLLTRARLITALADCRCQFKNNLTRLVIDESDLIGAQSLHTKLSDN